jgi:hypothetical protein
VSFWEIAQPLVARLAEKLGLPGNLPDSVDAAREKQRTRSIMAEAGLPTPKNLLISGFEDLPKAAKHVGFPAVIKPISGEAGATGGHVLGLGLSGKLIFGRSNLGFKSRSIAFIYSSYFSDCSYQSRCWQAGACWGLFRF